MLLQRGYSVMTDAQMILDDNYNSNNGSFAYFLQNKAVFNKEALRKLCEAIRLVADSGITLGQDALKINAVYGRTLKCFLYHFDAADPYAINNLPKNYNKMIEQLEKTVQYYFSTRI